MAGEALTATSTPSAPYVPGHKRSKTAILRAIVSPHKGHRKSASVAPDDGPVSNPLNSYMLDPNLPPQLPPINTSAPLLPPLDLEPPSAPFAREDRRRRLHKKSMSSISLSSMMSSSKRDESPSIPASPSRGSFDLSGALRDLMSHNRGNVDGPPSPQKPSHMRKPSKSKSAIDISLLRRKQDKKDVKPFVKDNKENRQPREPLTPLSPRSIHEMFSRGPAAQPGAPQAEELFVPPPKIYTAGSSRPRITPNGSDSSINMVAQSQSRSSTSSEDRFINSRRQEAEELMKRYTPTEYTPATQRSFFGDNEPTLARPTERDTRRDSSRGREPKPRPKSSFVPSSTSAKTGFSIASPRKSFEQRRPDDVRSRNTLKETRPSPTGSYSSNECKGSVRPVPAGLDLEGIDTAFEALLDSRGVPENMREKMRGLDVRVKQEFIHKERQLEKSPKMTPASTTVSSGLGIFGKRPKTAGAGEGRPKSKGKDSGADVNGSPTKRTRPRSRTFGSNKDKEVVAAPVSPTKRQRSGEDAYLKGKAALFPPHGSSAINGNGVSSQGTAALQPQEWVKWLKEAGRRRNFGHGLFAENTEMPEYEKHMHDVEVGVLHKLRLVLRNETLRWVETFTKNGGMEAIWAMVERVLGVEWREEHEDNILHELLLCLKGLCTASLALQKLAEMGSTIFPRLLDSLFDEEKKGPSEFTTRGIIISLMYVHLQTSPTSQRPLRTRRILSYLADKKPDPKKRPLDFIEAAHVNRPYRRWCREVVNVTKEVFWIFLHGSNIVPVQPPISTSLSYAERNFPQERPPVPAAAHVGGVEWEATSYLAAHLDLLNGCIASLATREERNDLRTDLRNSGWERAMGGALRTCKEKLHTSVHEGLKTWVRAASEDEWYVGDVRFGPRIEHSRPPSPLKARKKKEDAPPKLELGLGLDLGDGGRKSSGLVGGWEY